MAKYTVTGPNGQSYDITAPDSATQDQVMAYAKQHYGAATDARPFSQELGAEEGAMNVWDRGALALKWAATNAPNAIVPGATTAMHSLGIPDAGEMVDEFGKAVGLQSAEGAAQTHQKYFREREKHERPGEIGRFGGELAATAALPMGEDALLAGGIIGGLTGSGTSPGEIAGDVTLGALGGKLVHEGIGIAGRNLLPAFRSTSGRASDYVSRLMQSAGKSAADLDQWVGRKFGKPVTAAESIGRVGKTALTALGRREGKTPDTSEGFFAQRRIERASRMLEDMTQATGVSPEAAQGELDVLLTEGRKEAKPLYDAAFEAPPQTSKYLERLAREPLIQQGMSHGIRIERLAALAEHRPFDPHAYAITGYRPAEHATSAELPFAPTYGSFEKTDVEPIIGPVPTWKTWDAAKTGLDHIIETHRNPLTGKINWTKELKEVDAVRRSMLEELDRLNPAYKSARARAGDYLSAAEAWRDGSKALFSVGVTEKQFSDRVDKMSGTDLKALKGGVANVLFNLAQNARVKPNVFDTPRLKSKLIRVFGRDDAEQLIERYKVEAEMLQSENRIPPGFGSVTSEVLNAKEEQNLASEVIGELGHAAVYKAGGMVHAAYFRIANVVKLLAQHGKQFDLPVDVRNAVGTMLLMTPQELAEHLRARPDEIKKITQAMQRWQQRAGRVGAVGATQVNQPNYQ